MQTYNTGESPESAGKDALVVERGNLKAVVETMRKFDKTAPNIDRMARDKQKFVAEYKQLIEEMKV